MVGCKIRAGSFFEISDNERMFGRYPSGLSFSVVVEEGHRLKEGIREGMNLRMNESMYVAYMLGSFGYCLASRRTFLSSRR